MPNRSRGQSSRKSAAHKGEAPDRAFDPVVFRRAAELAGEYRFILERADDGRFLARAVEIPTVFVYGGTPNVCEEKIRIALSVAIATMLESGDAPPLPAAERRAQVNMRVTADEKTLLEESARSAGFRGLSDFVRFAALTLARGETRRRAG